MTLPTAPSRTMSQDTFDSTTDAFIGALPQFETDMNTLAAAMTLNATIATSATSNSVGAGSKSFTATTGKSFWPGMWLLVADTAAASTNYMLGNVTSYNSSTGALVFNSLYYQGSGTKTAWSISQSGPSAFGATIGVGNATPAATGGGVTFPATQSASNDANTFDDYEEGTCTLSLTFATPGDLNVVYSSQVGSYTKKGREVTLTFNITATTFTHTTASGALRITGQPFTQASDGVFNYGGISWQGITKTNYTDVCSQSTPNQAYLTLAISGSGQTSTTVVAADMPTGTTKVLWGTITYNAA